MLYNNKTIVVKANNKKVKNCTNIISSTEKIKVIARYTLLGKAFQSLDSTMIVWPSESN